MIKAFTSILIAATFSCAFSAAASDIPLEPALWQTTEKGVSFENHMGRPSVKINGGSLTLKDTTFKNGIIEFDVAMPKSRGFVGIRFRAREGGMSETFYLRSHQSGNPDANQYNPVFNNISAWQIYYGPRYSAPTKYTADVWTHVKLAINDSKMDVYIDSEEPEFHVEKLMHDVNEGGIVLYGFLSDYYISNVSVQNSDTVKLIGTPAPLPELATGIIKFFKVSNTAFAASKVEQQPKLDRGLLQNLAWTDLNVNEIGIANLSRISGKTRDVNTLLAKIMINSSHAKKVFMRYGFSDRVTIFLNGEAIAYGDDTFLSRDYRFLGTVGLYDGIFLPLKAGENEITFAVTEGFGGWALTAAIEDQSGLEIH